MDPTLLQHYLSADTWEYLDELSVKDAHQILYAGVAQALDVGLVTAESVMQEILSAAVMARLVSATEAVLTADTWNAFVKRSFPEKFTYSPSHYSGTSSDEESTFGNPRSSAIRIAPQGAGSTGPSHATGGTRSFGATLEEDCGVQHLDLEPRVLATDVSPVDAGKFRAVISGDGRLMTYDNQYAIHTAGTPVRYVVTVEEDNSAAIFVDQHISAEDSRRAGKDGMRYRALESHAQIDGQVACAGEITVDAGKVTYIDNHSGTYQPTGRHFAAILRVAVKLGILADKAEFAQFVAQPQNVDVDRGALQKLLSDEVWSRLRK
ncbi:hypothetical protein ACTVZO_38965 [Streptomyces sp. IBSNAI002]|uniref:hypothetical protein n=1 Tax=Streptomyces sp. IBSNAI002 TaxID=3457500 RepID=UPI003FD50276